MPDDSNSPVYQFESEDPEMLRAFDRAQESFKFFFREISWEKRRIIPALDLACVKVPFVDDDEEGKESKVEHMWLDEIDFDGKYISGTLINSPNWLQGWKAGDKANVQVDEISDWMYAIRGRVYGAYTVNLMRARMSADERHEHDEAWGLDFGDPNDIQICCAPVAEKPKGIGGFFSKKKSEVSPPGDPSAEHPMSESMAESLKESLSENPALVHEKDDRGWTILHQEALAGNTATVKVLLAHGADRNLRTNHGMTPQALAQSLGWDKLAMLLAST